MPNSRLKVTPRRGWPPLRLSLHLNRPAVTDLQRKTRTKMGRVGPPANGRKEIRGYYPAANRPSAAEPVQMPIALPDRPAQTLMGYVVGVADNSPADCAVASGKMSRRFFLGRFADQRLRFSACSGWGTPSSCMVGLDEPNATGWTGYQQGVGAHFVLGLADTA